MAGTQSLELPGYAVLQYLGSGARSTIWQVRDQQTGEVYALKRTVRRHASDGRFLEQAINEYEIGSLLRHPNVRRIFDIRRVSRWLRLHEVHLLMEMCDGLTVQADRPRDLAAVVRVFTDVASGLSHLHERNIVHCDTKPNNIVVAGDGSVKLIDFGQSCYAGTVKSRIQGTPDFIAPEQVYRRPVTARTDVYNFGASLYWTLTGRPIPTVLPKDGLLTLNDGQRVLPVEQLNPDVPASLSKLVGECIQLHPPHRPGSMGEIGSRLMLIGRQLEQARPTGT